MADHRREGHGTRIPRSLLTALALVASACSGATEEPAASRRAATTTTTIQLSTSKIIGGGAIEANGAATFPVEGGELKVLVPEGAVTKGAQVEVREVTGAPSDLGAIQRGGRAYAVAIKGGKIESNKQIALQFTVAAPLPITDPRPVGGFWDDGDKVWRSANADYDRGSTVTVFANKVGTYSWLRWSWDKAVQSGADAVRAIVGPVAAAEGAAQCQGTDDLRSRLDIQSNTGNALSWCAGKENNADIVRVRNIGQSPLAVRTKGFSTPTSTSDNPVLTKLFSAVQPVWQEQDGEDVRILEPGDQLTYPLTNASEKGLLRAELNGFAQHYDVLAAAAAFAAGFYTGNPTVAAKVLAEEPAVLTALVDDLTAPGCLNGLGPAVTGSIYTTADLATYATQLILKCVDPRTGALLAAEAPRSTPLASLRSSFVDPAPDAVMQLVQPALRTAIAPLVEPTGGPVAGEVIVSPKDSTGGTPSLTPVGTAAPVTPTVAPTDTTVAAVSGPATTLVVGTTTQATAPPAPTDTTVPATTTTTRAATTTTRAPATTTTTRAPATTTTVAPTTTTTAPPGPLQFSVNPGPCGITGGTLTGTGTSFRPGWRWTATFFSPNNAAVPGSGNGGNVGANGTIAWSFNCLTAPEPGAYKVEIAEDCPLGTLPGQCTPRPPVIATFTVNTYETRWVPDSRADRLELPVCSGFGRGAPPGKFRQNFVVHGLASSTVAAPTISQIGFANGEEFRGVVRILRGDTELFQRTIDVAGGQVVVSGVGLSGLVAGEVLTLEVEVLQATAAAPNFALNFARSATDAAPGVSVSTINACDWNPPAPPANTDLIGWIAP